MMSRRNLFVLISSVVVLSQAVFTAPAHAQAKKPKKKPSGPKRWEKAIAAFETQDRKSPPPQNAILFVGSSSIRLWKLEKSFPKRKTINRGFGGSQVEDSLFYIDRIVLKHKPRIVVLYAGDNDIAAKKTPQRVAADFKVFVRKVHAELPETRILFIAIKPSIRRWNLIEKINKANALVEKQCQADKRLDYVDIVKPMLGKDGKPRPELFIKDGLHLNDTGYKLWASVIDPMFGLEP